MKFKSIVLFFVLVISLISRTNVHAQSLAKNEKPKKIFVTFSIDRMDTYPLHFKSMPLEELAGIKLFNVYEPIPERYRSKDGLVTITNIRFPKRNKGYSITVYPLGAGNHISLAVRGSYETLPVISFDINSPEGVEHYILSNASSRDVSIGIMDGDRPKGLGLGAHSFLMGGYGEIRELRGKGHRYFVEFGGGINFGPIGGGIFVKISKNYLYNPRPHSFFTVPIGLRGTLSF